MRREQEKSQEILHERVSPKHGESDQDRKG